MWKILKESVFFPTLSQVNGSNRKVFFMNKVRLIFIIYLFLISCKKEEIIVNKGCATSATVRDLTGLDGCGFVFELEDGNKIIPIRLFFCGTPPLTTEVIDDPLLNFVFEDGKKVKIGYQEIETGMVTTCMVGKLVKITCIEMVGSSEEK